MDENPEEWGILAEKTFATTPIQMAIGKNLDVDSRLSMALTSWNCRTLAEISDFHLKDLTIEADKNIFNIYTDRNVFHLRAQKNAKEKLLQILRFPTLRISTLHVHIHERTNARYADTYIPFGEIFKKLGETKIPVESIVSANDSGLKVLQYILPNIKGLKSIEIRGPRRGYGTEPAARQLGPRAVGSEAWKGAKKFECGEVFKVYHVINHFIQFDDCNIFLCQWSKRIITEAHVDFIKKQLLKNPNLQQFRMKFNKDMEKRKFKSFQEDFETTSMPIQKSYNYPGTDKTLSLSIYKRLIWFKGPCYQEKTIEGDELEYHDMEPYGSDSEEDPSGSEDEDYSDYEEDSD